MAGTFGCPAFLFTEGTAAAEDVGEEDEAEAVDEGVDETAEEAASVGFPCREEGTAVFSWLSSFPVILDTIEGRLKEAFFPFSIVWLPSFFSLEETLLPAGSSSSAFTCTVTTLSMAALIFSYTLSGVP